MTLNEIVYELKLLIRRCYLSDDEDIDDRLIEHFVHTNRALWLRTSMNKGRAAFGKSEQSLGCVELETVDRSACSAQVIGLSLLRTTLEIPKTIEAHYHDGITEVSPIDIISYPFSYVPYKRARYFGYGRFNQNGIVAFKYTDDYIYLNSKSDNNIWKTLKYINVKGIFETPTGVASFTHVDGTVCYSNDTAYPLNRACWVFIKEQIIKANFPLLMKAPTDKTSDATLEAIE